MKTLKRTQLVCITVCCTVILLAYFGCQKTPKGYISDNIYYNVNPFVVEQGVTAVSADLVIDGSTTPLYVKLLNVREAGSGSDASKYLLKPDTIRIYKSAVGYADSTVALLNAKLKDSTVAPFSVNSIGGRLQFTQATKFVPIGQYNFDLQVSNIRGTRTLKNACLINVVGASPDTIGYLAYNHSDATFTNFIVEPASLLLLSVKYIPTGPDKIIFVWKDKHGINFNPANGEVSGRPHRATWPDWDPYYPQVKTDTSIEFGYPGGIPKFPIFDNPQAYPSLTGGTVYYSVSGKHTDIGMNANTTFSVEYLATRGTFVVTLQLTDITRVP